MSLAKRKPDPDFSRLRTALMGGQPDRVPLLELGVDAPVMEAFLQRKIAGIADIVDFWHQAGYDHMPLFVWPFAGIQNAHGQADSMHEAKSDYSLYSDEQTSRGWVEEGKGQIDSWETFETYPWVEVKDVDFLPLEEAARHLPEGMAIIPVYGCILNSSQWLMGLETFCVKMYEDPELVAAVMKRVGKLNYEVLKTAAEMDGVGAVWYGDDLGHTGGLFAAPDFLREHVFPWMKKIGDVCKKKDLPYLLHSDGNVSEVIEDLIECGINCLQPIEPKAMDIDELKRQYGDRLALAGNIDLSYTLTLGPPEGVEAEVKERIRTVGPGGGYCVGSSNSVTDYVPVENFCAMVEATFKYGSYPLDLY